MQLVERIVFRKLTDADFFNINKPSGVEERGGGQSYIDISTSAVSLANWRDFFHGIRENNGTCGPIWKFEVKSLGTQVSGTSPPAQEVKIAQRRVTSVAIRSQKLLSRASNRIDAWRPNITGFPRPKNPRARSHIYDLHVYIARLDNGEYWAGWFQASKPEANWPINNELNKMFTQDEGYLRFAGDVSFDTSDSSWPFRISATALAPLQPVVTSVSTGSEEPQDKNFFDEDERLAMNTAPTIKEAVRKIRVRNSKAVRKLKQLYGNLCQISGDKYAFKKEDGSYYSEAHHLIPLGEGGDDSVYNIVILNPLLHRMLHYAKVEGLNLTEIQDNKLTIKINDVEYVITWHTKHSEIVQEFAQ